MSYLQTATPDISDWITMEGAAEVLGCDRRTISRMIVAGRLAAHWPRTGKRERRPTLLSYAEVVRLNEARRLVRGA